MSESETFQEKLERLRPQRETKPESCSHCSYPTKALRNFSRKYGGNVGGHWLCMFCECTQSASRLGAGSQADSTVKDVAAMLNTMFDALNIQARPK